MARNKKSSKGRPFVLLLLLAVLCVGGAELVVCRFADPVLYNRITAPVRQGVSLVGDSITAFATQLVQFTQQRMSQPEPAQIELDFDAQQSGEAAIVSHLPVADPTITEFQLRDEREILTGGSYEIDYFHQMDDIWRKLPYGSDTIGPYGCGPAVMAMVVSSLTEYDTDPAQMSTWAWKNGHWAKGSGSYRSIIPDAAQANGLSSESRATWSATQLYFELASGKVAVALMREGHFTKGGHFILLRGATLDGGILVADPNSRARSLSVWDPQLLLDELAPSRGGDAPLWLLYPAPLETESSAPSEGP